MPGVGTIGLDIARHVFQARGADTPGRVVFRKEACGGAHYWGREIGKLGHTVRPIH